MKPESIAYEMAFKMQTEATEAFDLSKEPPAMRQLYGNSTQGKQLLLARRLIERGVRVVQVWASGWDHHQDLADRLPDKAGEIDGPLAAFLFAGIRISPAATRGSCIRTT